MSAYARMLLDRLRGEQAKRVMPLIGPLLDAWDNVPNDVMSDLTEQCPEFATAMSRVVGAIEGASESVAEDAE